MTTSRSGQLERRLVCGEVLVNGTGDIWVGPLNAAVEHHEHAPPPRGARTPGEITQERVPGRKDTRGEVHRVLKGDVYLLLDRVHLR